MSKQLEVHGLGDISINSLPMLKVSQSQTKGVADGDMRPGELFNSVTEQNYGKEIELVAFFRYDRRTKFPKRGEGTNIECFSPDMKHGINGRMCGTCPKKRSNSNYMDDDLCTDQNVFIVAPADKPGNWMLLPFMRSTFAVGKKLQKLLTIACSQDGIPLYAQKFKVVPAKVDHKKSGSTYFVMDVELAEGVKDAEGLEVLKKHQEMVESKLQTELAAFLSTVQDTPETEEDQNTLPEVDAATVAADKPKEALL